MPAGSASSPTVSRSSGCELFALSLPPSSASPAFFLFAPRPYETDEISSYRCLCMVIFCMVRCFTFRSPSFPLRLTSLSPQPTQIPVSLTSMNWASVVLVGFMGFGLIWYLV